MIVIKTDFSLCQLETKRTMIYAESDQEPITSHRGDERVCHGIFTDRK